MSGPAPTGCGRRLAAGGGDVDTVVAAVFGRAVAHAAEGRLDAATRLFRCLLRVRPELWQARANLDRIAAHRLGRAVALHREGRTAEAADLYRRVLDDLPGNADALHLLGMIEWQSGACAAGLARVMRALAVEPGHGPAQATLGRLLGELFERALGRQNAGFQDDAAALYRTVLSAAPAMMPPLCNLSLVAEKLGRTDEAAALRGWAVRLDPEHERSRWALGNLLAERERWSEAAEHFRHVLTRTPDHRLAPIRLRVAEAMAAGGTAEALERHGLLGLTLVNRQEWEPGDDYPVESVTVSEGSPVGPEHAYEVVEGATWSSRLRRTTDPELRDGRLGTLLGSGIVHAGVCTRGVAPWHANIVRRGGAGSNSGTLPDLMNGLFAGLYRHVPTERLFIDAAATETVPDAEGRPVFYLENFQNYGHWMLDHLPQLLVLEAAGLMEDCRIFSPWLKRWQIQTLVDLGLGERLIVPQPGERDYLQFRRFERLLLSSLPPMAARVDFVRRRFLPRAAPTRRVERLFISRRNRENTRLRNEAGIADFLEARGFTVLAPEELPFHEQIRLFSEARVVVSATGSAYTNLVFASPGTTYVELTGRRVFDVMRDSFVHYDMFPQLGIRHIVLVSENLDRLGIDFFPVESAFEVDLDAFGRILDAL